MRRKRGRHDVDMLEEEQREFFIVRVALGLLRPHGHRPVALLRKNRLVVPIGAFHEAHADGAGVFPRPRDEVAEVALAVAQVGLQRDADRGLFAKLVFFEDGFEKREREILQLVALHVEVDERADFARAAENRAESLLQRCDGIRRIGRMHVGRERGDFHRQIQSRESCAVHAEVAERGCRLLRQRGGDGVEHVEVALEKRIGLGLAHDGFAEEIDRGCEAELRVFAELFHEIVGGFASDELRGHRDDVGLDRTGDKAGRERRRGEAGFHRGIQRDGLVAEVFLQMADDLGGGFERGQDVDEAEELRLERRILHRPLHHARVGTFLGKNSGRGCGVHEREKFFTQRADARFDRGIRREKGRHGAAAKQQPRR